MNEWLQKQLSKTADEWKKEIEESYSLMIPEYFKNESGKIIALEKITTEHA